MNAGPQALFHLFSSAGAIFHLHGVPWAVALRTGIVYLFLLVGIRLSGKRQLGQMAPIDLILLLTLSNAVQNAMTGPDTSVAGGLLAATTLLLLDRALTLIGLRSRRARRVLAGEPTLLILRGQVLKDHCLREGIDRDELRAALREHGLARPQQVELAVLEMDGSISVVPREGGAAPGANPRARRSFRFLKQKY